MAFDCYRISAEERKTKGGEINPISNPVKDSAAALAFFVSSAAWTMAAEDHEIPAAGQTESSLDPLVFPEA